jgi:large subunit ribosomal protein L13
MKIIDGTKTAMGRLASFAAKELLKGEEIVVVNCEKVIVSGSEKNIQKTFLEKRGRHGSGQKGPIYDRTPSKIVKRTIRGMLPNYREGRGRVAFKKLRCYGKVPEEYSGKEMLNFSKEKLKFIKVGDIY